MGKKRRNTFKKEVAQNSSPKYGLCCIFSDAKLLKTMGPYFAKESQRWKRIKQK